MRSESKEREHVEYHEHKEHEEVEEHSMLLSEEVEDLEDLEEREERCELVDPVVEVVIEPVIETVVEPVLTQSRNGGDEVVDAITRVEPVIAVSEVALVTAGMERDEPVLIVKTFRNAHAPLCFIPTCKLCGMRCRHAPHCKQAYFKKKKWDMNMHNLSAVDIGDCGQYESHAIFEISKDITKPTNRNNSDRH